MDYEQATVPTADPSPITSEHNTPIDSRLAAIGSPSWNP